MPYPVWDSSIGHGLLMGVIAVLHVFVSHFAIGGGLYLVVAEHRARRDGDGAALDFLRRLTRFFVLLTLVFGALSGVGIWFIIGLLNPAATEMLIHQFVWAWAVEWTFFVVEIAAALAYHYGWDRMRPKDHLAVGWIYFAAAWLSLFVINGIVTFMLTPGRWLETGRMVDGFFNPTFWPSLVLRTGVCVMLAGLFALFRATAEPAGEFRARTVRGAAAWGALGLAVVLPALAWTWKALPADLVQRAVQSMPFPLAALRASLALAALLAAGLALAALAARRLPAVAGGALLLAGLAWFGAFETFREALRKPWIIPGHLYGNGVRADRLARTRKDGLLAPGGFRSGDAGADLFRRACRNCHTWDGYKALKPALEGLDPAFIGGLVRGTHLLRGGMPPFPGTAAESEVLAAHLHARTDGRPLSARYEGADLGRAAFARRCAVCHPVGGPADKARSFAGMGEAEIGGLLDMAADLGEGMPAYTGDAKERAALVAHLQELGRKAKP